MYKTLNEISAMSTDEAQSLVDKWQDVISMRETYEDKVDAYSDKEKALDNIINGCKSLEKMQERALYIINAQDSKSEQVKLAKQYAADVSAQLKGTVKNIKEQNESLSQARSEMYEIFEDIKPFLSSDFKANFKNQNESTLTIANDNISISKSGFDTDELQDFFYKYECDKFMQDNSESIGKALKCTPMQGVLRGNYTITSKNDMYNISSMNSVGDIVKISKKDYCEALEARKALDLHMIKVRNSDKTDYEPRFMEEKDFTILSTMAKLGLAEQFEKYKNSVSRERVIVPQEKQTNEEIFGMLKKGVQECFLSGKFEDYLVAMSKFHNYSFRNNILIKIQKPYASICASSKTWNDLGRTVKAGEKGLSILAPSLRKLTEEEIAIHKNADPDSKIICGFRTVKTFDVSQTEGKPLPSLCEELKADVKQTDEIIKALEKVSGIKINFDEIGGRAYGYYCPSTQEIVVKKGLPNLQMIKTAIHETAHSLFENPMSQFYMPNSERFDEEVRAESTAYMVCKKLGLDTSDYSFGYVSSWSAGKSFETLEKNMNAILKGTTAIVDGINSRVKLLETSNDLKFEQIEAKSQNNVDAQNVTISRR